MSSYRTPREDSTDVVLGNRILFTHVCLRCASLPQGHIAHNGKIAEGLLEEREQGIWRHFSLVSSLRDEF